MNNTQIKKVLDRYYENLDVMLKNITPGFDLETIHNFRQTYRNLKAFIVMISEHNTVKSKYKITKGLRKTYRALGEIRNLTLQQIKVTSLQNASQSPTEDYVKFLRENIEKNKQKLHLVILKNPVQACEKRNEDFTPSVFPVADFQIYCQLKIAQITSIIANDRISNKDINSIRKKLGDLYSNIQNFAVDKYHPELSSIFQGKDDQFSKNLLNKFDGYVEMCVMVKMIKMDRLQQFDKVNRDALTEIRINWQKDKQAMKESLVKKLKNKTLSLDTL